MLIDSHCHITALTPLQKIDISSVGDDYVFIDSSITYQNSLESLKISAQIPNVYSALGFHPFYAKEFTPQIIEKYTDLIKNNKKVVAVGEVGLEAKSEASLDEQVNIFAEFIKLAKDNDLPIVVHNRLDSLKMLDVLDSFFTSYEKVVFHCFSYSTEVLEKLIAKGGFISFSLNILRKKSVILESLKMCPLSNLLLETDSPYMRINRQTSTPFNIKDVYAVTSSIKGVESKELEAVVGVNIGRVFGIVTSDK